MATAKFTPEQVQAGQRIDALIASVYITHQGQEVLKLLKEKFLDVPVFSANVEAGKQATHAAYREGQNSVVRQILDAIERNQTNF